MVKQPCHTPAKSHNKSAAPTHGGSCHSGSGRIDFLLWSSLCGVIILYVYVAWFPSNLYLPDWFQQLSASVFELINTMWWGILIGIMMVAVLAKIPREFVISVLGNQRGLNSILRATAAGFLLDLCSHGILMVGAKLYERGASIGQLMRMRDIL